MIIIPEKKVRVKMEVCEEQRQTGECRFDSREKLGSQS